MWAAQMWPTNTYTGFNNTAKKCRKYNIRMKGEVWTWGWDATFCCTKLPQTYTLKIHSASVHKYLHVTYYTVELNP